MISAGSLNPTIRAVLLMVIVGCVTTKVKGTLDPSSTLDCHRRIYSYKVTQADSEGRICWDTINVMSCWGRCDSNEISDWRFPYKRSYHPVCIHGVRELRRVVLKHCEEGAEPGTEQYDYQHATTCRCHVCRSSEASCQGLRDVVNDQSDLYTESGGNAWNATLVPNGI
uniref:Glycoprotein hormone beta 5 n=1 Tax=Rhodnius prolixus TaxID=13249 RepID=A0A9E8AAU7_RHOPR|nr:glycoprotein hormone beta 5 [Rhodnius prolixus]